MPKISKLHVYLPDTGLSAEDNWVGTDSITKQTKTYYLGDVVNLSKSSSEGFYSKFLFSKDVKDNLIDLTMLTPFEVCKTENGLYFFVSDVNNLEQFSESKIFINILNTHFDLGAPTISTSAFNAWQIDVVLENLIETKAYYFNFWRKTGETIPTLQQVTDQGNQTDGVIEVEGIKFNNLRNDADPDKNEVLGLDVDGNIILKEVDEVNDATPTEKGIIKLAGDLGGTADSPTVPALYDKIEMSDLVGDNLILSNYTKPDVGGYLSALDTANEAFGKLERRVEHNNTRIITLEEADLVDSTFLHIQSTPSETWTVVHNLGKFPSVTVIDSSGSVVVGDITHINENELIITFVGAFTGKATLIT